MDMAERIREQRKGHGLSQAELAERVGLSLKTIQRWEIGDRSPKAYIMPKLAQILNTSVTYLMGLEGEPTPGQAAPQVAAHAPVEQTTRMAATGRLIYEWGKDNRLDLPDTPENRAMLADVLKEALVGRKPE